MVFEVSGCFDLLALKGPEALELLMLVLLLLEEVGVLWVGRLGWVQWWLRRRGWWRGGFHFWVFDFVGKWFWF